MIDAVYLDSMADEIDILYSQLHTDILKDMARRVKKTGVLTASAGWQANMLEQQGMLRADIIDEIAKYTNYSTKQVSKMFKDTLETSIYADKTVYDKLDRTPEQILKSSYSYNSLKLGIERANATLANLTGIIQNQSEGVFERTCTRAYMQVQSGAFTYEDASAFASDELLRQDKESIVYTKSGASISIEAGARRAIVTGLNQTTCQSMLNVAKDLNTNLVETTAHYGARPEHAIWQGRIFSLEGSSKNFPNFYIETGYGSVSGLAGANCKHNFHPFFEGITEPQYGKKQLDKWNNDTVKFNGKKMTYYDATQKMRSYERKIRGLKKVKGVNTELGADNSAINKKLRAYSEKARSLNKQTDVPLDYKRRRIARR